MTSSSAKNTILYYLISFAIGGLLGDVFFHTIPHLSSSHKHSHGGSHDHSHEGHSHESFDSHEGHAHNMEDMLNNFIIIIGIVVFFLIEKITHSYFGESHSHDHGEHKKDSKAKVS